MPRPTRPTAPSKHYVVETVTIAVDDVDLATMRVNIGTGGMYAVCEVIEVGDVTCEVRAYCRQIERAVRK